MYGKMTLVPTHSGFVYECFYCKTLLAIDQADNHECIARHVGHNAVVNDNLLECFDCPVTARIERNN